MYVIDAPKVRVKAIVPFETFERIFNGLASRGKCAKVWCRYSKTTCHVRDCREQLREWWSSTNGNAPGFQVYEAVLQNSINVENHLYWGFWTDDMRDARVVYEEFAGQLRDAFSGRPIDTKHDDSPSW